MAPSPQLLAVGDTDPDGYAAILRLSVINSDDSTDNAVIQVFRGGPELSTNPASNVVIDAADGIRWVGGRDLGSDGRGDVVILARYLFSGSAGYLGRVRALPGSGGDQTASDLVEVADFGEPLDNYMAR